jgi:hypothetical protein
MKDKVLDSYEVKGVHNYTITRTWVSGCRVKLTILVGGDLIGERTTTLPCLYALITCCNPAYAIKDFTQKISECKAKAYFYDCVHRREAGALAKLDRDLDLSASDDEVESRRVYRDESLLSGKYAEWAQSQRKWIAKYESELRQLKAGPVASYGVPTVWCWHQRRNLVRVPRWTKFLDVIEIAGVRSEEWWEHYHNDMD